MFVSAVLFAQLFVHFRMHDSLESDMVETRYSSVNIVKLSNFLTDLSSEVPVFSVFTPVSVEYITDAFVKSKDVDIVVIMVTFVLLSGVNTFVFVSPDKPSVWVDICTAAMVWELSIAKKNVKKIHIGI